MTSQRTLAFIKVWERCLNSEKDWEYDDIVSMNIENRVECFDSGADISNYWEYCLWFSDFVDHINVELFVLKLDSEVAEKAGFPGLGVVREKTADGGMLFKNFHSMLESVLRNPREWAAAYAETSRKNDCAINSLDSYIPIEFWEDESNGKKWELFKFRAISAYLIKCDPSDEEWNRFFSRMKIDLPGNTFSVQSIAGKVRLAMISSTFEVKLSDVLETHPELNKYSKDRSAELRAELNTPWKKLIKFANLRKIGLNQTGLNWINFYLKLFDHVSDVIKIETPLEHKIIIDGIFAVLYCYDHNSQLDFNADACPDCKKDFEECCKSRNTYPELINQWLEDLEYSDISKFKKMKMLYPHLTINIFNQLFHQLNCNFSEKTEEERDSTEPIILGMIFSWATLLVEEYTFSKLMSEVDKELFG